MIAGNARHGTKWETENLVPRYDKYRSFKDNFTTKQRKSSIIKYEMCISDMKYQRPKYWVIQTHGLKDLLPVVGGMA